MDWNGSLVKSPLRDVGLELDDRIRSKAWKLTLSSRNGFILFYLGILSGGYFEDQQSRSKEIENFNSERVRKEDEKYAQINS